MHTTSRKHEDSQLGCTVAVIMLPAAGVPSTLVNTGEAGGEQRRNKQQKHPLGDICVTTMN